MDESREVKKSRSANRASALAPVRYCNLGDRLAERRDVMLPTIIKTVSSFSRSQHLRHRQLRQAPSSYLLLSRL